MCTFTPPEPKPTCKFTQGDKIVATTNPAEVQDPTYKNRANITLVGDVCELSLTGLVDKPQEFKCYIKQATEAQKAATVDKSEQFLSFLYTNNISKLLTQKHDPSNLSNIS